VARAYEEAFGVGSSAARSSVEFQCELNYSRIVAKR